MAKGRFRKIVVPPDSSFHAKVSHVSGPDTWDAGLTLGSSERTHAELKVGTTTALPAPGPYHGTLTIDFPDAVSRAQVELEIVKPNGKRHGTNHSEVYDRSDLGTIDLSFFLED